MHCNCGFTTPFFRAPPDHSCMMCGTGMRRDADDFLLHGAEGLIKTPRDGQVKMARAVENAVEKNEVLVVEGPVGVGKSYAYMLPAMLSGKRAVVSTAQITLQTQLSKIDGPRLLQAVADDVPDISVAVLKGKSNYGCKLLLNHVKDVPEYAKWLNTSPTADLQEYKGPRVPRLHEATAEDCIGKACPHAATCGFMAARKKAKEAKLLIVNHHLAAFDLRFGPFKLLGEYNTLIIDEAHKAPGAFRGAFEDGISSLGYQRIVSKMDSMEDLQLPVSTKDLKDTWIAAFDRVKHLEGRINHADPLGSPGKDLRELLRELKQYTGQYTGIRDRAAAETADGPAAREGASLEDLGKLMSLGRSVIKNLTALDALAEPTPNLLLSAQRTAKSVVLKATPIFIGSMVSEKIHAVPSAVFTSATMSTKGGDSAPGIFDDFSLQLGLGRFRPKEVAAKPLTEMVVASPFNYAAQGAVLYMPKHLPPPVSVGQGGDRDKYLDSIARESLNLVRASHGNALILFTSSEDLREVHRRLELASPSTPWITQDVDSGQGADSVLEKFRATPNSVILGLKSFWEGVSVEGDKLWLVIVTKLPFPNPKDPLHQAQTERLQARLKETGTPESRIGFEVFQRLSLPPMITDMRQGAGRLIRTQTDRGVLAVLDVRIWTGKNGISPEAGATAPKGYGNQLVGALGFRGNFTDDFGIVAARYRSWLADE